MFDKNEYEKQQEIIHKREQLVVKSNEFVRSSRHHLSKGEIRLVSYIISRIKPKDIELLRFKFDKKEYIDIAGLKGNSSYENIKESIDGLWTKKWWFDDGRYLKGMSWINDPIIDKETGEITLVLSENMAPYLLELKEHRTQYELEYIFAMNSEYSMRLYELLKSYASMGSVCFEINKLKALMGADEVKSYKDYSLFRIKALQVAVNEINEKTDLFVQYKEFRSGRGNGVKKITFNISKADIIARITDGQRNISDYE
jgi:plasmid replication initiation protein